MPDALQLSHFCAVIGRLHKLRTTKKQGNEEENKFSDSSGQGRVTCVSGGSSTSQPGRLGPASPSPLRRASEASYAEASGATLPITLFLRFFVVQNFTVRFSKS
jgi:hypothetical protein